ncbi:MAG: serine hydrolase, partial [Planctomycetota bacterium]
IWLDDADRVIEHRAWGYEPLDDGSKGYRRSTTRIEILGDGALASNVVDLAKWGELLIDPPEEWKPLVNAMLDGTVIPDSGGERYGGGISIDNFHGLRRVQHGGAFVGFRAQMTHLPDQNLTAICLANDGSFSPDRITEALLETALGDSLPEVEVAVDAPEEPERDNSPEARKRRRELRKAQRRPLTEEESAQVVGSYTCPELRLDFEIELGEKGRHRVRLDDGETSRMQFRRETGEAPTSATCFGLRIELEWDAEGRLIGGTLNDGRARGMRFERATRD